MQSRLAIDYGAATVRAVLVTAGTTTALRLDGTGEMSTAVHVSGAGVLTGTAAWRQAGADPDGFVQSPLRAGTGQITAGTTEVEVVDLVAATLLQVMAQAQHIAGEPIDDVRLVVPAGWGPRRRTWLRHAARTAGISVTRLVETPIAALARPGSGIAAIPGRPALVLDVGAGCEVTVVQPGPTGAEVLSTLADPAAGGDRIDNTLIHALTGVGLDEMPADQRWQVLANTRAARHVLSDQVVVSMPMPGGQPPMIVNATLVAEAARPVFERVAELAAQALGNADLTVEQISGVHLIGAAAVTPAAADVITAKLGTPVQLVVLPQLAGVLGAADADIPTGPAGDADLLRLPPLRRLVTLTLTLTLPGLASLGLYAHFVLSAEFNNGRPYSPRNGYYVLANWGELTVAAALATITFLQAAALFAALLDQRPTTISRPAAPSKISGGIGLAIAAALATAALYAVTAAVFFNQPMTRLQNWALLPILPTAAAAGAVAVIAWRRAATPAGGWDGFLAFPVTSMITATAGIFAVSLWFDGGLPWWLNGWTATIGITGGLLVGVAVACTLVRHPGARVALTVPIGFLTAIISRTGPDILAVMWAIAVACWWVWHVWALIRTPPTRH